MNIRRMLKHDNAGERGGTLVLVAILLLVFLGVAALAIDIGHIMVVRNELQNAADAGALAGAADLYYGNPAPGGQVPGCLNAEAVATATGAATSNRSDQVAVEVNGGDVVVGNWNSTTKIFTPKSFPSNCNYTSEPINAVKVTTRRQAVQAASFFARIWGITGFTKQSSATAWIDSVGPPIAAGEFDQPIAICLESVQSGECNIGRMINSGSNPQTYNTGGWTSFESCNKPGGPGNVSNVICSGGNPEIIDGGLKIHTGQGNELKTLRKCWDNQTGKTKPWKMKLPLVRCEKNNISNCAEVVGAVQVEVVWITEEGNNLTNDDVPMDMVGWPDSDPRKFSTDFMTRWQSFVEAFNLKNLNGDAAPLQKKAIYFKPTCEITQIAGRTGGSGFNVIARSPVLVQ